MQTGSKGNNMFRQATSCCGRATPSWCFYESFNSNYSYIRLGKIRNVQNLKAAVGTGSVQMHFTAK